MKTCVKRIKGIVMALVYVAVYYVVSVSIQLIYYLWQKSSGAYSVSEIESNMTNGSYALYVIAAIISVWIYMVMGRLRKKPIYQVIHEKSVPPMTNIMALCLAVGTRFLVTVYFSYSQNVEILKKSIDEAAAISPQLTGMTQLLIAAFSVAIVAPFFEEVLFRGLVMGELMTIMRPWAANLLQAIIFGVAHAVLFQSIFAFAVGVILGLVYYRTGSIKTSAVCHGAFNLSVVFTQGDMSAVASSIFIVFGVLLISCSLGYIIFTTRKR